MAEREFSGFAPSTSAFSTDTAMDEGINLERQRSILVMVGNGFDAEFIAKNLVFPLDTVQKVIDNKI